MHSPAANHLIYEKSPYLLQHAYNPVNWYPWGEEAFSLAKAEDKPIFLSIGYSTCHWCHVMERESFEDEDIAALLRATVVAVKVDREERPDLDTLYMTFCQALTGRGGWPLTVILTPEGRPFFAGTYFPKDSGFGRIGLREVLQRVHMAWKGNWQAMIDNAAQIFEAVRGQLLSPDTQPSAEEPGLAAVTAAGKELTTLFDTQNGGFGGAPKFPSPHNLLFLLREYRRTKVPETLSMVTSTLDAMRRGGIWDHIGRGFHRYSTDAHWFVPHFEKMLYDQALLAMAYVEGFLASRQPRFARTARDILDYVQRNLTSPEGVFYSAEDADSEGVEGSFYLWTAQEISQLLPPEEAKLFMQVYGIEPEGNFHDEATGVTTGANIPFLALDLPAMAAKFQLAPQELETRLERCRELLLRTRDNRVHPLCDDKILTDNNGLMLAALAKAARAFDDKVLADRAVVAADFLLKKMLLPGGRLLHRLCQGEAAVPGLLDDYAFLAWGLIELYQTVFDPTYLRRAVEISQAMIAHFEERTGGFFLAPDDGESLLFRQKIFFDAAVPSGNSVAFLVLTTLFRLTGNQAFQETSKRLAHVVAARMAEHPSGGAFFLCGVSQLLTPAAEVTLSGNPDALETQRLARAIFERYLPEVVVTLRPEGNPSELADIAPFTRFQLPVAELATAHVCRAGACQPPTTEVTRMLELLAAKEEGHTV